MFEMSKVLLQLDRDGTPIKNSLVGTGTMGTYFAESICVTPGMTLDIVCDIIVEKAVKAMISAGIEESVIEVCETLEEAEKALKSGKKVATSDFRIACMAECIDVVCEATGVPDVYAAVGIEAINHKKHYVTMNIEGDVCVGHLMNMWAKSAGVVYTGIYGDEPGSAMLQYYEAVSTGLEVIAVGRSDMGSSLLKWNKETVTVELAKHGKTYENASIYASFCDGSKTNEECCTIANAIGFRPDVRGMHGPSVSFEDFVQTVPKLLKSKSEGGILTNEGVVERICVPDDRMVSFMPDFIWVFAVVRCKTKGQKAFMLRNKGIFDGDVGVLYGPYHHGSVQAPIAIATAAINHRAVVAPLEGRTRAADVVTMAKADLQENMVIDEIGGYLSTGRIECASITRKERLLPFALAAGTKVVRDIPKEGFLTYDDVEFPGKPSLIYELRILQDRLFGDMY